MPEGLIYLLALSLGVLSVAIFIRLVLVNHGLKLTKQELEKERHISSSANVERFTGVNYSECEFCDTVYKALRDGDDKTFMLAMKDVKNRRECLDFKKKLTTESYPRPN